MPEVVGGIAMYLGAQGEPLRARLHRPFSFRVIRARRTLVLPGCGCPLWFKLTHVALFHSLDAA
jgi:hypothetical protein